VVSPISDTLIKLRFDAFNGISIIVDPISPPRVSNRVKVMPTTTA